MSRLSLELLHTEDGSELIAVMEAGGIQTLVDPLRPSAACAPYLSAFDQAAPKNTRKALMIGAGAFVGPIHFIAEHPETHLVAVEMSAEYLKVAEELGFLPTEFPRLTPVIADGMRYLETCVCMKKKPRFSKISFVLAPYLATCSEYGPFDFIMVDAFKGLRRDRMFSTPYGLTLIKSALSFSGRVAFNIAVSFTEPAPLFALCSALKEKFVYVEVLQATFYEVASKDNFVVVASNKPFHLSNAMEL